MTDTARPGEALHRGKEAVVAIGRPVPSPAAGPADRRHHGIQGPPVKVQSALNPIPWDRGALRNAWVEFLRPYPFQWFATLTFERNVHPEAALKLWRRFTNEINRSIYGRRWMKRAPFGIYWIVAMERQKRGVVHFHALMGDPKDLNRTMRRLDWMDRWQALAGFARIEAVKSHDDALRYVTKYVIKDGEIEFSKNLGQFSQPELLGTAE